MANFNKERANKAFESLIGKSEENIAETPKEVLEVKPEPSTPKKKGAKKKAENHIPVTFYITEKQNKALRYKSIDDGCDMSTIIRNALDAYLGQK